MYKNGGEIPRRSVDQGLSTSPKSTTVDLFYVNYKRNIQECQLPSLNLFYLFCSLRIFMILQLKLYRFHKLFPGFIIQLIKGCK